MVLAGDASRSALMDMCEYVCCVRVDVDVEIREEQGEGRERTRKEVVVVDYGVCHDRRCRKVHQGSRLPSSAIVGEGLIGMDAGVCVLDGA